MYRQGDVLLVPVPSIPERAFPLKSPPGKVVLALGELTGHAHVLHGPQVELRQGDQERFVWIGSRGEAVLRHEEHGPIRLPAGTCYRLIIQREYRQGEDRGAHAVYD